MVEIGRRTIKLAIVASITDMKQGHKRRLGQLLAIYFNSVTRQTLKAAIVVTIVSPTMLFKTVAERRFTRKNNCIACAAVNYRRRPFLFSRKKIESPPLNDTEACKIDHSRRHRCHLKWPLMDDMQEIIMYSRRRNNSSSASLFVFFEKMQIVLTE